MKEIWDCARIVPSSYLSLLKRPGARMYRTDCHTVRLALVSTPPPPPISLSLSLSHTHTHTHTHPRGLCMASATPRTTMRGASADPTHKVRSVSASRMRSCLPVQVPRIADPGVISVLISTFTLIELVTKLNTFTQGWLNHGCVFRDTDFCELCSCFSKLGQGLSGQVLSGIVHKRSSTNHTGHINQACKQWGQTQGSQVEVDGGGCSSEGGRMGEGRRGGGGEKAWTSAYVQVNG